MKDNNKNNRRKAKGKRSAVVPLTQTPPFSATRRINLVFPMNYFMTESAAGTSIVKGFRLNNAFDVDPAVGSTATMALAAYSQFYTKYRVLRARARVEGVLQGMGGAAACVVLVPTAEQNSMPSYAASWPTLPRAKSAVLGPIGSTTTSQKYSLDATWNMWDILGITEQEYRGEAEYASPMNNSPVRMLYFQLGHFGQSSTPLTNVYFLTLSMDVELFSPVLIGT
jgi:hypothetical protein